MQVVDFAAVRRIKRQIGTNVWRAVSAAQFVAEVDSMLKGAKERGIGAEGVATLEDSVSPIRQAVDDLKDEWIPVATLAAFCNQSEEEVLLWIEEGRIEAEPTEFGPSVKRQEVLERTLKRLERTGRRIEGFAVNSDAAAEKPGVRVDEAGELKFNLFALPTGPWIEAPERFLDQL